jgi:hypothetical protein
VDARFRPAFQLRQKVERGWPDMKVHHNEWLKTVSRVLMMKDQLTARPKRESGRD